ncbi:amidohydrolase family protein [Streptomyces sp. NPDC003952]
MILGGVFDRHWTCRSCSAATEKWSPACSPGIETAVPTGFTGLQRTVREYLREAFYYTPGGWTRPSMLAPVQRLVGTDRIMFSTDYPYASLEDAYSFLTHLELSQEDKKLTAHGIAERLLRIPLSHPVGGRATETPLSDCSYGCPVEGIPVRTCGGGIDLLAGGRPPTGTDATSPDALRACVVGPVLGGVFKWVGARGTGTRW